MTKESEKVVYTKGIDRKVPTGNNCIIKIIEYKSGEIEWENVELEFYQNCDNNLTSKIYLCETSSSSDGIPFFLEALGNNLIEASKIMIKRIEARKVLNP